MIKTILGTKKEMSSAYDKFGRQMPVTYIVADTNVVVGLKDDRVILGFGKKKKAKKTENIFVKAIGYSPRFIKEITQSEHFPQTPEQVSQQNSGKIKIGDKINVSIFAAGDLVKVTGITRGKGFAGSVKRWGFAGGPKTHGQSDRHRAPGSIGAGTTPGRVYKGKKMAGHMGNTQLTVTNLEVIEVDLNKNLILIKGSVPGAKNGVLIVEKTGRAKMAKALEVQKVSRDEDVIKESKGSSESKETQTSDTPDSAVTSDSSNKENNQNAD
ncbi:50S ribosomal protein L3 [Candidatus Curtissbacteria bacterium RIFCSPLOWO2_01_FULL_42_26]|uniref:50S ribosomal protein L3 n=1 Tax=Candidatus Curtissbacteria bacterium RIFCSPLOWO2_01_FULL_42_26 TaxID=1797729 RepID=A0A1F5I1M6_9BACT|nr:MAG: 50S ribosomal protein L3 [Candidatus Curtissbacteria bacterium RIFCSPLOWO2_01_FULL_42_26]